MSDARDSGLTQPKCCGWKIHANLVDRIDEAKEQGWLGEVAAIETTLAAAAQKLAAMQVLGTQRSTAHLGMPVSVRPLSSNG